MRFYATHAEESTASRCLALIERHCPALMRMGGGGLGKDCKELRDKTMMTRETRDRAISLAKQGKLTATEIARSLGATPCAVAAALNRAGVKAFKRAR